MDRGIILGNIAEKRVLETCFLRVVTLSQLPFLPLSSFTLSRFPFLAFYIVQCARFALVHVYIVQREWPWTMLHCEYMILRQCDARVNQLRQCDSRIREIRIPARPPGAGPGEMGQLQ